MATEPDSEVISYAISGGEDAGKFVINPITGVLNFAAAVNASIPTDSNTNNEYIVEVSATDAQGTDKQKIIVKVFASSNGGGGGGSRNSSSNNSSPSGVVIPATPVPVVETPKQEETPVVPSVPTTPTTPTVPTQTSFGFENYIQKTYENEDKIESCGSSIVTFSDIGNEYQKYIVALEKKSGLNGIGSGEKFNISKPVSTLFNPEKSVTRSEFLKMVLRSLCIDYSKENVSYNSFKVEGEKEWQAKVVNKAAKLGFVSMSNSRFRENDAITGSEALKMLVRAYGIPAGKLVEGTSLIEKRALINRGEAAKIIMQFLFSKEVLLKKKLAESL
jgi:hypothetical protein